LRKAGDAAACVAALDGLVGKNKSASLLAERAKCKFAAGDKPGARADVDAALGIEASAQGHALAAQFAKDAGDVKACKSHWAAIATIGKGNKDVEAKAKTEGEACGKK
jgi:hypothetical protein